MLSATLPMKDFSTVEDTGMDLPARVEPLAMLMVETESASLSTRNKTHMSGHVVVNNVKPDKISNNYRVYALKSVHFLTPKCR